MGPPPHPVPTCVSQHSRVNIGSRRAVNGPCTVRAHKPQYWQPRIRGALFSLFFACLFFASHFSLSEASRTAHLPLKPTQLPFPAEHSVKMSAPALNKIAANSPSRQNPSELETSIAGALYDLETNTADLKAALRPLQFVSAREVR